MWFAGALAVLIVLRLRVLRGGSGTVETSRERVRPFGELLARHRAAAGLTQQELAVNSGVSERALRDLERGVRTPRPQSARLLAEALTLTGHDLTTFLGVTR